MAKFEIYKDKKGEFRFRLKAGNGKLILVGEGYTSKANCLNGIESVRENTQDNEKYDKLESTNGKLHFNIKAANGQVIGSSEMYESARGMENGMASVKKNAPRAKVVEILE
ncbi:MAG: YegP family protein [Lutibacter sp.]|nr:YegP family protein [Lutibacter sp.]